MGYIGTKPDDGGTSYTLPPGFEGHKANITEDVTLDKFANNVSVSTITVSTGGTITVPTGTTWTIIS